jgi:biopolymer transport protein ExbD
MAMKSNQDSEESISEINVVPLVDIILVVLIIFMVTAPMFMKPSINVNLPKASTGDKTAPSKLNLTLTKDGRVLFNGAAVNEEEVQTKAAEVVAADAEIQAIISADREVPHGSVVRILDFVKAAGVKRFAISIENSPAAQ